MPARIATTAGVIVGLGMLAVACGGTVAGRDGAPSADQSPTATTELGRFLPTTAAPPSSGPVPAADESGEERPIVPATTLRATTVPPSTVARTEPDPIADPPVTTVAAPTTTVPTTEPRPANAPPPVPTYPPYTVRPALTGVAALTGLPAPESVTTSPVLVAKIDNVGSARPQWALDRADVVFEENVEGATRFMALFHSDVPAEVGPVRSARTTDIDLLSGMNRPILAWSGGNPGVTSWIGAAAEAGLLIDVAAVRSNCYRRESSRRAPHNLVAKTGCLLGRGAAAGPARPLWEIDEDWTRSTPASADSSFEVRMDNMRAGWTWDASSGTYLRSQNGSPHVAAGGARIAAANVVVVYATHVRSAVDARSPEAITVGTGTAVIHRDGVAITGTWSRRSAEAPFVFRDVDGGVVPLQAGPTFVELARAG